MSSKIKNYYARNYFSYYSFNCSNILWYRKRQIMTQEEKQLLLKDLCARSPYCPKIYYYYLNKNLVEKEETRELDFSDIETLKYNNEHPQDFWCVIVFKPYLRPMSSMTEEEQRTLNSMCNGVEMVSRLSGLKMFDKAFDWLNAHHFDFRGLIEKGLALEAPEGMYK